MRTPRAGYFLMSEKSKRMQMLVCLTTTFCRSNIYFFDFVCAATLVLVDFLALDAPILTLYKCPITSVFELLLLLIE